MNSEKWDALKVVAGCITCAAIVWAIAWATVEHNREAYRHGRVTTVTRTFGR